MKEAKDPCRKNREVRGKGKVRVEAHKGKWLERDRCRVHIKAVYASVSLQLRTYEGIFVSQADSALCQVMITTTIA